MSDHSYCDRCSTGGEITVGSYVAHWYTGGRFWRVPVVLGITVIIPSMWERGDMLAGALASVGAQSLGEPETRVVIGTTKWDARNVALETVRTPWTVFLDDDDFMLPNHLQTLATAQHRSGADVVYSLASVQTGGVEHRQFGYAIDPEDLRTANHIPTGYMVRTELAQAVGGFPAELPEDWGFLLRLLDVGATFHYADPPEPTWVINIHGANTYNAPDF